MKDEFQKITQTLAELRRISGLNAALQAKISEACCSQEIAFHQNDACSNDLYELLKANGTALEFLNDAQKWVNKDLFRLLYIHFKLIVDNKLFNTLSEIRESIQQNQLLKKYFATRQDINLFIIYLELFGLSTWIHFANCSDGEHIEFNILTASLPYCKAGLNDLLKLISKVKAKYPDRSSYRLMGSHILLNMGWNSGLREEVLLRFSDFFDRMEWKEMLPIFLKGAINNEADLFGEYFEKLLNEYAYLPLAHKLYSAGVSCPNDTVSLSLYHKRIKDKRNEKVITDSEYLNLLIPRNEIDEDIIQYLLTISKVSRNKQEILYISDILQANIDKFQQERWFRQVAIHIIPAPFPELVANFNDLLSTLIEKDPILVYQLLKVRFWVNGSVSFLEEPWHELPNADPGLFEEILVDFFNAGNRNVHLALHHLFIEAPVDSTRFQFSQEKLAELTTIDKYFIACKVTGYVYDKIILRTLLFSLTSSVLKTEEKLLDELFSIYTGYVIYNYRSILEEIKKLVARKSLPPHLATFYQRIIDHFENYFNGLDMVPALTELRADKTLAQHVNFYNSQQMNEQLKESQKTGLSSFFKTVPVNSHGWAIKRKGEKIHHHRPLGLVRSEMEFPAGEILNPVSSERFRVVYQQLQKDEININ
jgi:hypothetical protein